MLIQSLILTHILTSPQPILIIPCQYLSQSTDQRLYCTFRAISVMQELGMKKESYFQRCNCLWAYLVHIRALRAQPQTPVPDKPHLWNSCLVSHFLFISSKHSLYMPSYEEDTRSHHPLYPSVFINIFINIFSYFPVYHSFVRLLHRAGDTMFQPVAVTSARGSDAAGMP